MTELKEQLQSLRIAREPLRRRRRWPIVLLLLLFIVLAGYYVLRTHPELRATEVQTVRASVQANAGAGTPVLTASGYVVARRKAVVSAKIQGRLAELRVEEGSVVRDGDVIARLESADYEAQIQRAKAAIARAGADLDEWRRQLHIAEGLHRESIASQDQLDAARSRVSIGEAALQQAKADLRLQESLYEFTLIRAPFSGVVVKKMAEVGESVAPIPPGVNISTSSGAIVALADMTTLEVEVDVNESNVAQLRSHQPAEVVVQAFPDRRYRAVLRQVIPTADRTRATVMVKVTILDKDKNLKPEMSANVTFLEPPKRRTGSEPPAPEVTIPKDAVATRAGRTIVFEVRDGRAYERAVVTGSERQGNLVVKQGLSGKEVLVANPPDKLRDGDGVRVKS